MTASTAWSVRPSTADTPNEYRCPLPHPKHPGSACDRLLLLYGRPTVGVLSLKCPRCRGTVTSVIRAT